jgi:hypothetical protein
VCALLQLQHPILLLLLARKKLRHVDALLPRLAYEIFNLQHPPAWLAGHHPLCFIQLQMKEEEDLCQ